MCSTRSLRTISSRGFIAAVTRTAGPRSFEGAGLSRCTDQWLGGRDSELTCVCSLTTLIGVSIGQGPGDSYPAAEIHVLCEAEL